MCPCVATLVSQSMCIPFWLRPPQAKVHDTLLELGRGDSPNPEAPEIPAHSTQLRSTELEVLRWGRNAAISGTPKDVSVGDYKKATALEVLVRQGLESLCPTPLGAAATARRAFWGLPASPLELVLPPIPRGHTRRVCPTQVAYIYLTEPQRCHALIKSALCQAADAGKPRTSSGAEE